MMKTIFADYNAITTSGHLRLNFPPSREDMRAAGIQPGDWAWLSDGEVMVGARVENDPRDGVVGVPDWQTLVHLDDEESRDSALVRDQLLGLLARPARSLEEEKRLLELLTIFDVLAPPEAKTVFRPGYLSFQRAAALVLLGKPELALLEIEDARRLSPGNPQVDSVFLEVLRRTDLARATHEAEAFATNAQAAAGVLAECINVLATHADSLPDDRFRPVADRILAWVDQFERAPGRDQISAATLAQLQFNRALVLLRLGQSEAYRNALILAHAVNPVLSEIDEAARLTVYDQRARDLAARVRARPNAAQSSAMPSPRRHTEWLSVPRKLI
jgi:hypothetical protein